MEMIAPESTHRYEYYLCFAAPTSYRQVLPLFKGKRQPFAHIDARSARDILWHMLLWQWCHVQPRSDPAAPVSEPVTAAGFPRPTAAEVSDSRVSRPWAWSLAVARFDCQGIGSRKCSAALVFHVSELDCVDYSF